MQVTSSELYGLPTVKDVDPVADITEIDILNDVSMQDVLKHATAETILMWLAENKFDAMLIACDCSSFTIAAGGSEQDARFQLRSKREPWGMEPFHHDWKWYLIKHNALVNFTTDAIELAECTGTAWINEHPPDYGDKNTDYYWEEFKLWASIWDTPRFIKLKPHVVAQTFDQGAKGAPWRGKTTLWSCKDAGPELRGEFAHAQCSPFEAHAVRARGRNEYGESNSRLKASYSAGTCDSLAVVLHAAAKRTRARRAQVALETNTMGRILCVDSDAPRGSSPHMDGASQGSSSLFVDVNDINDPLAELLPVSDDPPLEHVHTIVSWRIATALVIHGFASLYMLSEADGAGFRLGPGRHVESLSFADESDSHCKKRMAAAVKLALALVEGVDVVIKVQRGASAARSRALPWLLEQLARRRTGTRIHLGSSKPHASEHEAAAHTPAQRSAPSGSLRQLEPELDSVLAVEPFPITNECPHTQPDPPLKRVVNPPGPFTTAELIPAKCYLGSKLERRARASGSTSTKACSTALRGA